MHRTSAKLLVIGLAGWSIVSGCAGRDPIVSPHAPSIRIDPSVRASASSAVITMAHVPLDRVTKISRFRSGVGHDYSDGAERCRSMKHYFQFVGGEPGEPHDPPWTTVPIVSPLDGTVVSVQAEWAGDQIRVRSNVDARYTAVLFHVRRAAAVDVGSVLAAGQAIGMHASDETMSDLAVEFDDPAAAQGRRLASAFDEAVMGDGAFAAFAARGAADRAALIISRAERDGDPLECDGERFAGEGRIANWVVLAKGGGTETSAGRWRSVLPSLAVGAQGAGR